MRLSELFPADPIVKVDGTEYSLKFTTRAMLELDKIYDDLEEPNKIIGRMIQSGIKPTDLVNFLYAGLIGAKTPLSKDTIIEKIEPRDFSVYADAIFNAWLNSKITPEQLEKLEVLMEASESKKKSLASETMPENTPSLG